MHKPSATNGRRLLERTLARFRAPAAHTIHTGRLSPEAFRAVVDERLRSLEHQLNEVKGRVNGLIFLLAGAVATQLILRLAG